MKSGVYSESHEAMEEILRINRIIAFFVKRKNYDSAHYLMVVNQINIMKLMELIGGFKD